MFNHQFCIDSEGPLCLNDNAFELTKIFVPQGDRLFATLSAYDDYLVDIAPRSGYKAGNTLRLILPFLKAYGATNKDIEDYSREAVNWVPNARGVLECIRDMMEVFIITTSYEQFAYPMYQGIGIPKENIYCTKLNLDDYHISAEEIEWIKGLAREITAMPPLVLEGPLSAETKLAVSRLDEIFWQNICGRICGQLMQSVQVMGGEMKAWAIQDSLQRTGVELEQVMFVGDSITDVEALKVVCRAGGLSVSFNGNAYALAEAELACISSTADPISALALCFAKGGRKQAGELAGRWNEAALRRAGIPEDLIQHIFADPNDPPQVEVITCANRQELVSKSQWMRKRLRGKQVGALG